MIYLVFHRTPEKNIFACLLLFFNYQVRAEMLYTFVQNNCNFKYDTTRYINVRMNANADHRRSQIFFCEGALLLASNPYDLFSRQ